MGSRHLARFRCLRSIISQESSDALRPLDRGFSRPLSAGALAVLAPWPTAGPTLTFLQLLLGPTNAAFSGHLLLGILDPADELVTGQRRDVLPGMECRGVGNQGLAQISWKLVHHPTWHPLAAHMATVASQAGMGAQLSSPIPGEPECPESVRRLSLASYPTLPGDQRHVRFRQGLFAHPNVKATGTSWQRGWLSQGPLLDAKPGRLHPFLSPFINHTSRRPSPKCAGRHPSPGGPGNFGSASARHLRIDCGGGLET